MTAPSSIGYARYAHEFHEASLATDRSLGTKKGFEIVAPVPVMYLSGHSIELIIKSYLIHKNTPENKLRNIGHDLEKGYKRAKNLGISDHVTLNDQDIEALGVLNTLYKSKQLNYMEKGAKTFPIMGPVEELNKKLLNSISPLVGYNKYA